MLNKKDILNKGQAKINDEFVANQLKRFGVVLKKDPQQTQ